MEDAERDAPVNGAKIGARCVQSTDFYDVSAELTQVRNHDQRYLELLSEEAPDLRSSLHPTIEQAIASHDEAFSTQVTNQSTPGD